MPRWSLAVTRASRGIPPHGVGRPALRRRVTPVAPRELFDSRDRAATHASAPEPWLSMRRTRSLLFIAVATTFEGLRAGIGLLRLVLDLPARQALGPSVYADFFRATDLTSRGFALYLTYGFGGALLSAFAYA